ncbi:MAG: PQQ-binding-like beta-propeller repeat protein, partial [Planctomycetota bacterium]
MYFRLLIPLTVLGVLASPLSSAPPYGPTPTSQPWSLVPAEWNAPPIQWRPTWEETLKANVPDEKVITGNPALAQATGNILVLWRVELLKALCERFPQEEAKRIEAYKEIAGSLRRSSDIWGRDYWSSRLAEDFPHNPDARVTGYSEVMGFASFYRKSPGWTGWWDYANKNIERLGPPQGAFGSSPLWGAWSWMWNLRRTALVDDGRFEEARRLLEPHIARAATPTESAWWLNQLADLYKSVGHAPLAAEVWEKTGNVAQAQEMRAAAATSLLRDFPDDSRLESRWEGLSGGTGQVVRKGLTDTEGIQLTLDLCQQSDAVPLGSTTPFVPFRAILTRAIGGMVADQLVALRNAQDAAAKNPAREASASGDPEAIVRLVRRFPWARHVHELLVEAGERQLQAGGYHWAARAFSDVLAYSVDPSLRQEAQVGLWLSLSGGADGRAAAERAMAGVSDEELLPWRGGKERAGNVKKAILPAAAPPPEAQPLSAIPRRRIELPPSVAWADAPAESAEFLPATIGPWAIRRIAFAGGRLYLDGPSMAACYSPGGEKPLWWRHSTGQAGAPASAYRQGWFVPGRWPRPPGRRAAGFAGESSPAVAADLAGGKQTFVALVNDAPPPGERAAVVAFDAADGRIRWSTASREEWKDLRPLNAPAAATGRVYVLAVAVGKPGANSALTAKISLVCLDAEDGRMLWRRLLGSAQTNTRLLGLAADGMPVTLHGGWVYCSTDLGLIAKCDARDGAVEWLAAYGVADQAARSQVQSRREGASPLLAGDALVVAPRDHSGLIAFDSATGKMLWETPLVPSDCLVGRIGTTLMTRSGWELGGVDLQSGRELWTLPLEGDSPAQACLRGQEMLVLAGQTLKRVGSAGAVVEALALTPRAGEQFALLPDGTLAELGEALEPAPAPAAPVPALALPLVETWRLSSARPILLTSPPDRPGDSFCVVSGRSITRVRTQPGVGVMWKQSLPIDPVAGVFAGEFLLLSDGSSLTALDLATGAIRWHLPMGFGVYSFDGDGQIAVAVEISNEPNATVVEMATGKVLWHKIISEPMRFGDLGAQRVRIRREDAGRTIAFYWMGALYGDKGWRASELTVEARTGALLGLHPCLAEETSWPRAYAFETRGAYFLDSLGCFKAVTPDGAATTFASKHAMDMGSVNSCPPAVGVVPTPGGVYAKSLGELLWFDLAARREVVCELPRNALAGRMCLVYAARELGEKLLVVSGTRGRSPAYVPGQGAVFADLFDRTTGAHLAQQELPGLACLDYPRTGYETQAEIVGDAVIVTSRDGVHVFAAAPSAAAGEVAVPRADAAMGPDGGESGWQGAGEAPLAGADGKPVGAVRIAHDNRRLFLSVTAPGGPHVAFRGRGTFDSGGEYVEVSLAGPNVSGRWLIGVDAFGRGVARDVDGEVIGGVTAFRSVQPLAGVARYEISLPLSESLWSSEAARHMRLGVVAGSGERAQCRASIYLQPFTRGGQEALKAVAVAGGAAGLARAGMDRALEGAAGVAEKYLSQWVYIAGGVRPTALCVGLLSDGQWRYASWHDPTPPQALARPWSERANLTWWAGPIPAQGSWVELRVPLSALGMHVRAIEGVVFRTESPGRVLWDRTSVVYPGGTRVLVEGAMPTGQPLGQWTWAGDFGRTAGKVHEGPSVTSVDEPGEHGVVLSPPAAEHAGAVPAKAVLSQWVFLDPARPPGAVALQLSDGRRWSTRWVWGQGDSGSPVGPLPPVGQWTQLRLPLDRTPLAGEPITGIAFDQTDGRAVWGATAIEVDGRSVDVISDRTPPMLVRAGRRVWGPGDWQVLGGVEPVEGKVALAARFDGRTGCLVLADSPRLALKQFTVEGWVRIDPKASGTQWIVSKNESAEGMTGFDLSVTDGQLRARMSVGTDLPITVTSARALVEPGTWRHVAMTWDGTALCAYVDGKSFDLAPGESPAALKAAEGVASILTSPSDKRLGPSALYVGRRSAGGARLGEAPEEFHLRGSVDSLRLYARALSPGGVRSAAGAPADKLPRALRQVLLEDFRLSELLAPADPGAAWEWAQRDGRAGHTLAAGAIGSVHAAVDLIEPVTQHLGCQRGAVVGAIEKALPTLGGGPAAWRLFDWMRRLEGGQGPARVDRLRGFLRTWPAAAGADQAAALLAEALLDANAPPDQVAPAAPLRRADETGIREWLVVGPWPNDPATRSGFSQLFEPELKPIDLRAKVLISGGDSGPARWRVMRSTTNVIDLRGEAPGNQQAVMVAACFAYARQPRRVLFEFGCDDSMDVRVNRRLVHKIAGRFHLVPREAAVEVVLPAGWSEIMLKVGQGKEGAFGFTFEACDPATGSPVED